MDAATVVQMCSGWRDVGGHLERVAGALTVLGSALVLTWSRLVLHGILHAQARRTQGASCIQMELARMEVLANSRWALATVCACHGAQCDRQQVPNAIRQQRTYDYWVECVQFVRVSTEIERGSSTLTALLAP